MEMNIIVSFGKAQKFLIYGRINDIIVMKEHIWIITVCLYESIIFLDGKEFEFTFLLVRTGFLYGIVFPRLLLTA